MAAEKLTKGRLAQILFMLCILIIAFTWRSLTHSNNDVLCYVEQDCVIENDSMNVNLKWQMKDNNYRISSATVEEKLVIELINSEAILEVKLDHWLLKIESLPVRIRLSKTDQPLEKARYINFR
ncbi:hypothetical protein L3V77_08580 [Vibrio sp. DW001]|uniref:hypothetical protein n=1 Tax=Vibrio sp. DW001 TaxID=2912315 RepID=UPI0023B0CF16|nr:hypothetical protein [Vibrio sp. DW001]WED28263.1 hypothetical protein L3V77_08580 [Vibrio sp. DW001]